MIQSKISLNICFFSSYKKQRSRKVSLLKLIRLNLLGDRINVLLDWKKQNITTRSQNIRVVNNTAPLHFIYINLHNPELHEPSFGFKNIVFYLLWQNKVNILAVLLGSVCLSVSQVIKVKLASTDRLEMIYNITLLKDAA